MEFRQFHYLLKIAETGTISRAAQELYISQPSLSQLLSAIEKKLGVPLFDRSTTPLQPTDAGRLYLQTAQKILMLDQEFQQRLDDMLSRSVGTVTIGSSPFRSTCLFSKFLPSFFARHPDISVQLRESTTRRLEDLAFEGSVDLVVTLAPLDKQRFDNKPLFEEALYLALPASHAAATEYQLKPGDYKNSPLVSLTRFKDTPFIVMQREQKIHDTLWNLCRQAGFTPQTALETRSMSAAQALAGAGIGVTLLPETLIVQENPSPAPCYVSLDTKPTRSIQIAWRHNRYLSHAARCFMDELQKFCQEKYVLP